MNVTNPMREARAALALHPCCGAHCRTTGQPCKSPAMPNGRCRMHGGMNPGAPRGARNGAYRHGMRTKESMAALQAFRREMRHFRELAEEIDEIDEAIALGLARRAGGNT